MEINTHEKFLKTVMEVGDLHEVLKMEGYKGTKEEVIVDLLGTIANTTAYIGQEELTEEEYFQMLIKEMNVNY